MAIGGVECLVVTIRTATMPHFPVTVRTCKATVKRNLLHLASEYSTQIAAEFVI